MLDPSLAGGHPSLRLWRPTAHGSGPFAAPRGKFTDMSTEPFRRTAPTPESRIHGCLLGGALGDSLGYAVEFDDISTIRSRFGPAGLQDFSALDGGSHFSDDTQMTLYTVDGLRGGAGVGQRRAGADANACLWLAYLRWLATQGVPVPASAPVQQPRWIDTQEVLKHRRAPGNACLSGLATGEMGTVYRPVNPGLQGLRHRDAVGAVRPDSPHRCRSRLQAERRCRLPDPRPPSARQSAGVFSLLIHALVVGHGLHEAAEVALNHARGQADAEPALVDRLERALQLARLGAGGSCRPPARPEELVRELGEGWVAEEALAVALYAVLATAPAGGITEEAAGPDPQAHFRAAIALAVNHSGDSDSTGSIAGNILGAFYGEECLPAEWLEALEAPEVIRGMAGQLSRLQSPERDVVAGLADVRRDQAAALQEPEDHAAQAEAGEGFERGCQHRGPPGESRRRAQGLRRAAVPRR